MLTIRRVMILLAGLFLLVPLRARLEAQERLSTVLTRWADAVVLTGHGLSSILGARPETFAVLAVADGKLVPIPFQIDEKTRDGRWVVPTGPAACEDEDPTFDANDELVFMAADAGPRWIGAFPDAPRIAEVTATDPVNGARGYAYVLAGLENPPRSDADYVDFDEARMEVRARDYVMAYDPKAPISIGKLLARPRAGGSGLNIADRLKIRFHAKVLGLFPIDRNEEDFSVEEVGLKDGPVRVIRETVNWTRLFWRIPTPKVEVATLFYGTKMIFPIAFDIPFDVNAFLANPSLRLTTDSTCKRPGRTYYNSRNPRGVAVDGKTSPDERALDTRQYDWALVAGTLPAEPGGWLSRVVLNRIDFRTGYRLFYLDDLSVPDPPENEPGSCANIGYEFEGIPYVRKGIVRVTTYMYPMGGIYQPGDERTLLDDLDRPLEINSRPIR